MCAAARIQAATPAPVAAEMLTRIGALYDIERDIRGKSAETRKNARNPRAKPIIKTMKGNVPLDVEKREASVAG